MVSEWDEFSLEDITELIVDCPHSTPKWTDEGVIVLRNQNIRNGKLNLTNPSFTNVEGYESRIKRAVPQEGDLVLTREAPMGEVCEIPKGLKCCLGQRMVLIRADQQKLFPRYLLYMMQGPYLKHQISWNEGTGTTVSNIRIPNIKAFQIPLPPLEEQKRIAHILGSLDDKIELNRKMNEMLEQMAQALFKSWFVDFDPVIDNILLKNMAKYPSPNLSQGERDSSSTFGRSGDEGSIFDGIPEELSEKAERRRKVLTEKEKNSSLITHNSEFKHLFPSEFELTDEMGWIPKGWGVGTVESVLELAYGKALKKADRKEGEVPVYGSGGVTGSHNNHLVEGPGIIIGRKGTVGSVYWEDSNFFVIDTAFYAKPKGQFDFHFCYYLLQTLGLEDMNTDAAVPGLNRNNAYRLEVSLPDTEVLGLFTKQLEGYRGKIKSNSIQVSSLVKLRDALLPKLLSGSINFAPDYEFGEF